MHFYGRFDCWIGYASNDKNVINRKIYQTASENEGIHYVECSALRVETFSRHETDDLMSALTTIRTSSQRALADTRKMYASV